jgi:propanol-preferring alcohol dehydrogenase
MLLTIW